MKVTYDAEVDIVRIILNDMPSEESIEDKPGIIMDNDAQGKLIGIEILDAMQHGIDPHSVEYSIIGLKPIKS